MLNKDSLRRELADLKAELQREKAVANSLKITNNGTYGKLGSKFSAFYSPDLMLAVCLTGQLNLLILIDQLESIPGVNVHSANTDGILVGFPPSKRDAVQSVFDANSALTGFEYEETPYSQVAFKDVNNYIAVGTDGKVKGKGLYAGMNLVKNPTMQVCTSAAIKYLTENIPPEEFIPAQTNILDFLSVREVKGGGVQYDAMEWVDDWELVEDFNSAKNVWFSKRLGKRVTRKSKPKPVQVGVGGVPFGKVARWYISTEEQMPIAYVTTRNRVAKTEGGKLCMALPASIPADLNYQWYIEEAYKILEAIGVDIPARTCAF